MSFYLTALYHNHVNLNRALLPDIVKFSYIPKNDLKVNEEGSSRGKRRAKSPDFTIPSSSGSLTNDEEHVLVLELSDNLKGIRSRNVGWVLCFRVGFRTHQTT